MLEEIQDIVQAKSYFGKFSLAEFQLLLVIFQEMNTIVGSQRSSFIVMLTDLVSGDWKSACKGGNDYGEIIVTQVKVKLFIFPS